MSPPRATTATLRVFTRWSHTVAKMLPSAFQMHQTSSGSARTHGHPSGSGARLFQHQGFTVIPPWDAAVSAGARAKCPAQSPATLGDNHPCHQLCWGQRLSSLNSSARFPFSSAPAGPIPWEQPWVWLESVKPPTQILQSTQGMGGQDTVPSKEGQNEPFPSYCISKAPAPLSLSGGQAGRRRDTDSSRTSRLLCVCRHPARLCPARRHL